LFAELTALEMVAASGGCKKEAGRCNGAWVASGVLTASASHVLGVKVEAMRTGQRLAECLALEADDELVAEFGRWSISGATLELSARVDVHAADVSVGNAHALLAVEGSVWCALTLDGHAVDALREFVAEVGIRNLS
jgi:hypothetical protein